MSCLRVVVTIWSHIIKKKVIKLLCNVSIVVILSKPQQYLIKIATESREQCSALDFVRKNG